MSKNKSGNIIKSALTKELLPNIYAITFQRGPTSYQYIGIAYTLEEAFVDGRKKATLKDNSSPFDWNMEGFNMMTWDELKTNLFGLELVTFSKESLPTSAKNEQINNLMTKIIDSGDTELFEKNKKKLTQNEIKYLEEKIKKIYE